MVCIIGNIFIFNINTLMVTKYFFFEKSYYAIVCILSLFLGKNQSLSLIRGRLSERKFATQSVFLWLTEYTLLITD